MSVLWSCFLTCYNFASTWKSIVMFLMLISNVVFLIDSMSSMVLQQLPHLQKLDGLTLQADASRDYTTNHIYLQHVLCLGSVSDAVFFKIVSGILFTTPSDVQQSLHLPENTTYNSWYVNSKGLVHPKMNIKSICNMQNGNVFLYFNLHFTIHMRKV